MNVTELGNFVKKVIQLWKDGQATHFVLDTQAGNKSENDKETAEELRCRRKKIRGCS